ncbi:hypothetical protein Scep_009591 [Stephania cephalantha]|uniref:Uncharacterized protein n=1 Tax=Stephania cephalantha TaxID=152367 RepID=A0AAP0JUH5_9MAGN
MSLFFGSYMYLTFDGVHNISLPSLPWRSPTAVKKMLTKEDIPTHHLEVYKSTKNKFSGNIQT